MGKLLNFAKKELELIGDKDDSMQQLMNKQILEIIKVFENHGHSGFSANYAASILYRLLRFKPLKPLTGEDDEWNEIRDGLFQNNRFSEVFKENDKAYWINGKIFSDDGGETWYTSKDSRVEIEFPFIVPDKPERIILK